MPFMEDKARHHNAEFAAVEVPTRGTLTLKPGEVHVWWSRLDRPPMDRAELSSTLQVEEILDAQRQRQIFDRRRKTVSRGLLRLLVASYLGDAPESFDFLRTDLGKPYLKAPATLRFSVSHSAFGLLMAFADNLPIGVDIEALDTIDNEHALLRRCFSAAETERIVKLPKEDRSLAIKTAWTRKEAIQKALAAGVFRGMSQVEVNLGQPARRLNEDGWTLQHLNPEPHYIGALATRGAVSSIRCYSLLEI